MNNPPSTYAGWLLHFRIHKIQLYQRSEREQKHSNLFPCPVVLDGFSSVYCRVHVHHLKLKSMATKNGLEFLLIKRL